jgi:hypothetical protein
MSKQPLTRNKFKIAFTLPGLLQSEVKVQMQQDGYKPSGKSRWIIEAINELLETNYYPDLVKLNDEMQGLGKNEFVVVPIMLKQKLDQAVISIRKQYPELNGVQSRILRTAIVQRLLRVAKSKVT